MTLVKKAFFDKNDKETYDNYLKEQIEIGRIKLGKHREEYEYDEVSRRIFPLVNGSEEKQMICLASRNTWEKQCFQKNFPNFIIKDLDIIPNSGCDYIKDFNKFEENWKNKWDIVYTNAPDHSIDAESAFLEWVSILKPKGLLIVGWSIHNTDESGSDRWYSSLDCTLFGTLSQIRSWIET